MPSRSRELQMLFLIGFAAVPLYLTAAIAPPIVGAFHAALGLVALATATSHSIPGLSRIGRLAAALYLPFFFVDAIYLSSLIRASVHLLFFIAVYQALDVLTRGATLQRLLVGFLIFLTSLATSTHPAIIVFVLAFALLGFAQLIHISHDISRSELGLPPQELGAARSAIGFAVPTLLLGAALFPMLPRVHDPFVRGMTRGLDSSATGMSETIDFRENRRISSDPSAVARVWMPQDAIALFGPLRLRATVYDAWIDEQWRPRQLRMAERVLSPRQSIRIARPEGYSRTSRIEQRSNARHRLLIPDGTWSLQGFDDLWVNDVYRLAFYPSIVGGERVRGQVAFEASVSRETTPLLARPAAVPGYPISPQIRDFAQSVVGGAETPRDRAQAIETHLQTEFRYIPDPARLGRNVSVDRFLLDVKRGHCEYFAAGMVVLLEALGEPARIVGGYYGGDLNPLIGSVVMRERDAHAWVEVFDGDQWVTYDPTPPSLRPGAESRNLLRAYAEAIRDSATYFWDRYILTFGTEDQLELLSAVVQGLRNARDEIGERLRDWKRDLAGGPGLILPALLLAGAAAVGYLVLRRRRNEYERLLALLEERGVEIDSSTAPTELLDRLEEHSPELRRLAAPIVEAYLRDRFSTTPAGSDLRGAARRSLRALQSEG